MADFVGTQGDDVLVGTPDSDNFTPLGGDDTVTGFAGQDTTLLNVSKGGADRVDLGADSDFVEIRSDTNSQVRLTFTSSEVGNGSATDSNTMANQNGGLAVRVRTEDSTGEVSRFDDEGITFFSKTPGVTFDVRDLVTGAQRGDEFQVVQLGTADGDVINQNGANQSYYINAGAGDDSVVGGNRDDFLVGGSGDDTLRGQGGDDTLLGGGGNDRLFADGGSDVFIFASPLDEETNIDTIRGFDTAQDTIRLENDVFTGLTEGQLDPEAFAFVSEANEADDRILYNEVTGRLLFDEDGGDSSNAIVFAQLGNQPDGTISADDFVVI